jgi:DNA-binding CsgD family transcriptional regulator
LLPLGIVALTLDTTPKLDRQFELFLRTVSTITLQHLLVKCKCDGTSRKLGISGKLLKSGSLTERQQIIKNLIEKGLTNPAIADEIGYSESLVRQETMAIYAILNISGRKDLLGYSGGGS